MADKYITIAIPKPLVKKWGRMERAYFSCEIGVVALDELRKHMDVEGLGVHVRFDCEDKYSFVTLEDGADVPDEPLDEAIGKVREFLHQRGLANAVAAL